MSSARTSRRGWILAGVLALAGLGAWLVFRGRVPAHEAEEHEAEETVAAAPPPRPGADPASPPPPGARTPPQPASREEEVADDGVGFMPASGDAPHDRPFHPHPITPQHKRIFAENRLIGQLNGAMDVKDVAGMRRLLKEYREGYPEDANDVQVGYEVVADCLEHPNEAARAAAVRFGVEHRGSTVRRWVNRYCLEPPANP